MKIVAAKSLLKANDQLAAENRAKLEADGVFGLNVVGSPGAGKTTLLEALFTQLKGRVRPAVHSAGRPGHLQHFGQFLDRLPAADGQ